MNHSDRRTAPIVSVTRFLPGPRIRSGHRNGQRISTTQGFTLLETLLSLALCSVLVLAISSTIQLYWNYRVRSESKMSSATLLRAVTDDLRCDLRAAIRQPPAIPEPFLDTEDTDSVDETAEQLITEADFREKLLQFDLISTVNPVHFAGGPDWLLVLTGSDSPRFPTAGSSHRFRHILWYYNEGRPLQVPVAGTVEKPHFASVDLSGAAEGLVRVMLPVTESTASMSHTGSSDKHGSMPDCRIEALQLAYFDGTAWRSSWPRERWQVLPAAVRVTCRIADESKAEPPMTILLSQASSNIWEIQP